MRPRDNDTKRAFGVFTISKNGTNGRPIPFKFYQWYQSYQHKAANNADKIQHGQIKSHDSIWRASYTKFEENWSNKCSMKQIFLT